MGAATEDTVALQVTAHQVTLRRIMVRQATVDPAALQPTEATVEDLAARRTTVEGRTMAEAGAATAQLLIAHQAMAVVTLLVMVIHTAEVEAIPVAEAVETTPAAAEAAIPTVAATPVVITRSSTAGDLTQ